MTKQQQLDALESEITKASEIEFNSRSEFENSIDRYLEVRDGEEMDSEW